MTGNPFVKSNLNSTESLAVRQTSEDLFLQKRKEIYQTLLEMGSKLGRFEHPAELPNSCEVKYFDRISNK